MHKNLAVFFTLALISVHSHTNANDVKFVPIKSTFSENISENLDLKYKLLWDNMEAALLSLIDQPATTIIKNLGIPDSSYKINDTEFFEYTLHTYTADNHSTNCNIIITFNSEIATNADILNTHNYCVDQTYLPEYFTRNFIQKQTKH